MRWAVLLVLALTAWDVAFADPTVFIYPEHVIVQEGEAFDMSIRVDAGTDTVTCFLVEFVFEGGIVQLSSAEEGSLFANCGYETMFHWDVNGEGWHSCNDVTLGHWAYAICPGELVDLSFEAVSWGETEIEITTIDLRDINRDPIPNVQTSDGLVTVAPVAGVDEADVPVAALSILPNPFSDVVEIALQGCQVSGPVEISIYDVAGRLVARHDGEGPAISEQGILWDGRDVSGQTLPSGTYFAVARGCGWERRARIVRLK